VGDAIVKRLWLLGTTWWRLPTIDRAEQANADLEHAV
jgi:hypothetical protein